MIPGLTIQAIYLLLLHTAAACYCRRACTITSAREGVDGQRVGTDGPCSPSDSVFFT